jgi:hypothetical protein
MSKSNNPLTNYFKRKEILDNVDEVEADKTTTTNESNEDQNSSNKRFKLGEFTGSGGPASQI